MPSRAGGAISVDNLLAIIIFPRTRERESACGSDLSPVPELRGGAGSVREAREARKSCRRVRARVAATGDPRHRHESSLFLIALSRL
jgi:hypothetical protein